MSKIVEDETMPEANDINVKKEGENQSSSAPTMSDLENKDYVTLTSQEGDKFKVKKNVAQMSELVKTMIPNDDDDDDDEKEKEIPLVNVKSNILGKVIEWMEWHTKNGPTEEIEKPLKSQNMSDIVSEWDANYIKVDQDVLFELILAANYMDIKLLLDLTCATIASMIKGKTPEEIRKTFNIVNDFTPEEEALVREENKWCEEA